VIAQARGHHGDPPILENVLLGFTWTGSFFMAMPQRSFRPHGLAIWGAPPGAMVEQLVVMQDHVQVSCEPIPARFFAMGDSYAQLGKLIDEGKEPPNWVTWPMCLPGCSIRVGIRTSAVMDHGSGFALSLGPADGIEICMWGQS
jgi:hypothetical protein